MRAKWFPKTPSAFLTLHRRSHRCISKYRNSWNFESTKENKVQTSVRKSKIQWITIQKCEVGFERETCKRSMMEEAFRNCESNRDWSSSHRFVSSLTFLNFCWYFFTIPSIAPPKNETNQTVVYSWFCAFAFDSRSLAPPNAPFGNYNNYK